MTASEVREELAKFLAAEFGISLGPEGSDVVLFSSGQLNSMDILQLVLFLEKRFGLNIGALDISIETFDSANAIVDYVVARS